MSPYKKSYSMEMRGEAETDKAASTFPKNEDQPMIDFDNDLSASINKN